jgi:hypothetical protein
MVDEVDHTDALVVALAGRSRATPVKTMLSRDLICDSGHLAEERGFFSQRVKRGIRSSFSGLLTLVSSTNQGGGKRRAGEVQRSRSCSCDADATMFARTPNLRPFIITPGASVSRGRGRAGARLRLFRGGAERRAAAKLLSRDEARRIAPTSPSCRSCCGGGTAARRRPRAAPRRAAGAFWRLAR